MNIKRKLLNIFKNILFILSDKQYQKIHYKYRMKKKFNLEKPTIFNKKFQWLMLNDGNPKYTKMVDKYKVKKYVADIIGQEYIIPTLGIYDSFDDIDFSRLPNQFVIKCIHDSGGILICKNKAIMNVSLSRILINDLYLKINTNAKNTSRNISSTTIMKKWKNVIESNKEI